MGEEPLMIPAPTVAAWKYALYQLSNQDRNDKDTRFLIELLEDVTRDADNDPSFDWENGRINFASDRVLRAARYDPDTFIATLIRKTGISVQTDELRKEMIERVSKEVDAKIASVAITDDIHAAVRRLDTEEELLKRRLRNREITEDEYLIQWNALMDRTPEEVINASTKFAQGIVAALSKPPGTTEA